MVPAAREVSMITWIEVVGAIVVAALFAYTVIAMIASVHMDRTVAESVDTMIARAQLAGADTDPYDPQELAGLPEPVVRYFEFALQPGQAPIVHARFGQKGEFATKPGKWRAFRGVEHFTVVPPAFIWDASIRMVPLVPVRVLDSYADGYGSMNGRLASLVTVVNAAGNAEIAQAALQRYLAEAAWMPTALLPRSGVHWSPIDEHSASATIHDGAVEASVDFHFAPHGEITSAYAERYRSDGNRQVLTPWEGRFAGYRRWNGMMIPTEAEVAWILPEGRAPYWRGRTTDFACVLAPVADTAAASADGLHH
jgi:Family of unknown function (DUF6920)